MRIVKKKKGSVEVRDRGTMVLLIQTNTEGRPCIHMPQRWNGMSWDASRTYTLTNAGAERLGLAIAKLARRNMEVSQ